MDKILINQIKYEYSNCIVIGMDKQKRMIGAAVSAKLNDVDIATYIKTDRELSNKEIKEEIIKKLGIYSQGKSITIDNVTINVEYAGVDSLKELMEKVEGEMVDRMARALKNIN